MKQRKMRTMRDVWNERPRTCFSGVGRGGGAELEKPRHDLVRLPVAPACHIAKHAGARRDRFAGGGAAHPWIFRRRLPAGRGVTVKGRVMPVLAPKAELTARRAGHDWLILYFLPHLERESIEVELKGDVLHVGAQGKNGGKPFEVFSEVLLPNAIAGRRAQYFYAGEILEVRVAPA